MGKLASRREDVPVRSVDELIDEALQASFQGWDFSWLQGRAEESAPPWDYAATVQDAARSAHRMLDVDTGGAEFLAHLAPFPGFVVATEGHPPNVPIARGRLSPLGISVVQALSAPVNVDQGGTSVAETGSALPFGDGVFDLVVNRHSSYWPSEARRVLRPGGRFITQQRSEARRSGADWSDLFGRAPDDSPAFDAAFAVAQLRGAGFDVTRSEEADTPMTFFDLGAVVYYLRAVPWEVEGFDPVSDRATLERLHEHISSEGRLVVRGSLMLVDAESR